MRGGAQGRRRGRRTLRRFWLAAASLLLAATARGQLPNSSAARRLDSGRATVLYYPSDERLARSVAGAVVNTDSFPGIPRPVAHIVIAIAPDMRRFREWAGPSAPEWGIAVAFPESNRIVMQGKAAGSEAGDPIATLRHELAHLALHESMGNLPPRWFDEGYASMAAHEWNREDALSANFGLAVHGMPTLDQLETEFEGGSVAAQEAYALAYRAVVDLSALGGDQGLAPLMKKWKATGSLEKAIRLSYGITLTDFETQWRSRTRLRYGGLALASNLALGGAVVAMIILPVFLIRRRRDRERLAAMRVADARAEAAAAADPLSELLDATSQDTGESPDQSRPS